MRTGSIGVGIVALFGFLSAWGAAPEGPYLRSEFSGGSLANTVYVFGEGRVAYAADGDLRHFDFDAHANRSPRNAGRMEMSGESMIIRWGDGSTQEGPVRWDARGGGFQFYGAPFAPLRPLADVSRLQGRYYGGASWGGASSAFDLHFDGAGGYQASATGSVASTSAASEVSALAARDGGGRYRLQGDRLDLGDGQVHWIYEVTTGQAPYAEMLVLDGAVLTRDEE